MKIFESEWYYMARTTTYDIAQACNVSQATVDRALNNRSNIKKETKELILRTAVKMNYRSSSLPEYYEAKKSNVIGIILPASLPFYTELLVSITQAAKMQGFHTMVSFSNFNLEQEKQCLAEYLKISVDGIIVFPVGEDGTEIKKVLQMGIPVVTLIRKIKNYNFDFISMNYEQAASLATQYLIDLGHTRIGYFTIWDSSANLYTYNKRLKGIKHAMKLNGLILEDRYVLQDTDNCQLINNLVANNNLPTAFICFNDLNAIHLLSFLNSVDIKVPDRISIVSFDNISMLRYITPQITSIEYPFDDIAETAVGTLLMRAKNQDSERIVKLFDAKIIRKSSCKKLPDIN